MLLVFARKHWLGRRRGKFMPAGRKSRSHLLLEKLEDRLAPAATPIRSGFDQNFLADNDDNSTGLVSLGFTANYFGSNYSGLYVNNNGNVTFGQALSTFTPFGLTGTTNIPIIAPFFADVDTRGGGTDRVRYGTGTVDGHAAFGVNWPGVAHYSLGRDKLNYFQVVLISREDTGAGNFDIEFNYQQIQWETGDASGGSGGLGGQSARVGFSSGSGIVGTYFELSGSGVNGAFLDSNAATGLSHNSYNSEVVGRYVFQVRANDASPPSVSLDAPADGVLLLGNVALQASASDNNGVSRVEFYVDGILHGTDSDGSDGWSINLNTATLADGAHNWSATAYDLAGNSASAPLRTFTVDTTPPTLVAEDITVNNDPGQAGANVTFEVAISDNSEVSLNLSHASGSFFALGTTVVTATATDAAGNSSALSFNITVLDAEAPTLSVPEDITVSNDPGQAGANVSFNVTAADNSGGFTLNLSHTSGSFFALGSTVVTATATDAAGNSTTLAFNVTVLDVEAPTLNVPEDITVSNNPGQVGASVTFNVSAGDNSGNVTLNLNHVSGSFFGLGTTLVTATAIDAAGNSTTLSFNVTVLDVEAPTLRVPEDVTVSNNPGQAGANVSFNVTATDNSGNGTLNLSHASGSFFALGTTVVTATATDAAGNSTTLSFNVTVLDAEAPTVVLQGPASGTMLAGNVTLQATAADNHAVARVEFYLDGKFAGVDADGSDGWSFDLDTTTLSDGMHSWSAAAFDVAGHRGDAAARGFEVDNVPPQITLGGNAIIGLNDTFTRQGSFADFGQSSWTVFVHFGDTDEIFAVPFDPEGNTFQISHLYGREGDFVVTVTVSNGFSVSRQSILVHTVIGDADNIRDSETQTATPGNPAATREIQGTSSSSAQGTLTLGAGTNSATLWVASYLANPVGNSKTQIGGKMHDADIAFFDVRITGVGASTGAQIVLVFKFEVDQGADDPVLVYFNGVNWVPIVGHPTVVTREPSAEHAGKDMVTFVVTLDDFSTPKVHEFGGTVFTVAVPAPATPPPTAPVPTTPTVASTNPLGVPFPVSTATFNSTNRLNLVLRVSQGTEVSSSTNALTVSTASAAGNLGDNLAEQSEDERIRLANLREDEVEFLQRQFRVDWLWRMMNGNAQPAQAQPIVPAAEQDIQQDDREGQPEEAQEAQAAAGLWAVDFVFAQLARQDEAIFAVEGGAEWLVSDRHEQIDCGLTMAAAVAGALAAPHVHRRRTSRKRRRSPALAV